MVFHPGDFLMLLDGSILEVVYSDESKAVCLKIFSHNGVWFYDGGSAAISNKQADYNGKRVEWEKVPRVDIGRNQHWKPLATQYLYPML